MDQIINIVTAAANILVEAANEVKAFVTANTPESALLAAIAVAYQQYTAGSLNGTQATFAILAALVVFIAAEANKDKTNP